MRVKWNIKKSLRGLLAGNGSLYDIEKTYYLISLEPPSGR